MRSCLPRSEMEGLVPNSRGRRCAQDKYTLQFNLTDSFALKTSSIKPSSSALISVAFVVSRRHIDCLFLFLLSYSVCHPSYTPNTLSPPAYNFILWINPNIGLSWCYNIMVLVANRQVHKICWIKGQKSFNQ